MPQAPRLHITSCVHIFDSSYPIFCFCAANSKGGTNITILEYLRNYISLGSNAYDAPSKMSRTDGFCSLNWGIVVIMGSSCSSDLSPMLCFPVIFFCTIRSYLASIRRCIFSGLFPIWAILIHATMSTVIAFQWACLLQSSFSNFSVMAMPRMTNSTHGIATLLPRAL